jgi:hypothetical protein
MRVCTEQMRPAPRARLACVIRPFLVIGHICESVLHADFVTATKATDLIRPALFANWPFTAMSQP